MSIKDLNEKLSMYEDAELSLEDCKGIFAASVNYDTIAEEMDDWEEPITVEKDKIGDYTTTKISIEPFIHILDGEDFKDYMLDIAASFKSSIIDDYIEPYFNVDQFYHDCRNDYDLREYLLVRNDIEQHELVDYNGKEYAIIKE